MNASNRISKAFTIRDIRRPNSKHRQDNLDSHELFVSDDRAKKLSKDEEKKIAELSRQLSVLGMSYVPQARLQYVLRAQPSDGNVEKAFQLLMLYEDSISGLLKPFNPKIKMLGAVNREKITCYLDSLLFAMLAKVDVFEAILYKSFDDVPRRRLVNALRLWTNMLRTGRLITTDITQFLQDALAECGWEDASRLRQQDVSEAFGFITDALDMPLLTLKTDIFHSGKEASNDDHKFVSERLLDVAIPEDAPSGGITLEQCLEEYFNNRVEIKRELKRRETLQSIHDRQDLVEKSSAIHIETAEVDATPGTPTTPEALQRPLHMRERHTSIFNDRKIEIRAPQNPKSEKPTLPPQVQRRKSSVRKEVLMPAWQFLSLIPWYTDSSGDGDPQVAHHFSRKRPMLGICLKRYQFSKNGASMRMNTKVDIPLEMMQPHFAMDDEREVANGLRFKLVLESLVCHRGQNVNSGHYIAFARTSALARDSRESFADIAGEQATNSSHDVWLKHDDLALQRVTMVDISAALEHEYPYLLFYRVKPVDEESTAEEPPPYTELDAPISTVDQKLANYQSEARQSPDVTEPNSRRASGVPSDEDRSRERVTESRRVSSHLQSNSGAVSVQNMDIMSTGEHTPADDSRADSLQSPPGASKIKSSRPSSEVSERSTMAKISSRFSRDKLRAETAIVDEHENEEEPNASSKELPLPVDGAKSKSKGGLGRLKSKRGRNGKAKGGTGKAKNAKEPSRDCLMM